MVFGCHCTMHVVHGTPLPSVAVVGARLQMAPRYARILTPAEAQSRVGPEDPPFFYYTQHIVLSADGTLGAGLNVHVQSSTITWATVL